MWISEDNGKRTPSTAASLGIRRLLPFAYGLLLASLCFLPSSFCLPAGGLYDVQEIKQGVYVVAPEDVVDTEGDPQFGRRTNSAFIVTSEGVVAVNTTNTPFRARDLLFEIRRVTDLPVRYVIDTDAHPDLMLGNEVFVAEKSTIVATNQAAEEMREYARELPRRLQEEEGWRLQSRMRGIHPTPPSQSFDTEMRLKLGGEEIRVVRRSGGHSQGDAVVYLPREKVLFTGHLFENGFFPRLDSSDVHRWIEILKELESWDVEQYVPARGPVAGKREVTEFRKFLEWLWNEVSNRAAEGKSVADVKRDLKVTDTYAWSSRDLVPHDVEEVYEQAIREKPTPAAASKDNSPY